MQLKIEKNYLINWNKRHKTILDSFNILYMLFDPYYSCLDINETVLKVLGGTREKYVGHNCSEWLPQKEFKKLYNICEPLEVEVKKSYPDNELASYQFEYYFYHEKGKRIPLLFNNSIIMNQEGKHEMTVCFVADISEQKKIQSKLEEVNIALRNSRDALEKEKKMLEGILFGIEDCVAIFDENGNLLLCNPKGIEVRDNRQTPLLPLIPETKRELALNINNEERHFIGQVTAIQDQRGIIFAYLETLKDITSQKALAEQKEELFRIKRELKRTEMKTRIIGNSQAMQKVFDAILRCAEVDSNVLILGETGVGKELVARAIHSQSARKDKPFVAINCGALPETLMESELFGHVKGAFTGANTERKGLFREAQGGTLFLDEVGDLHPSLQGKLLRAIQEKEIRPLGGDKSYAVDIRIISATHRDLKELIKQKSFRNDLYYRIEVIPLTVPPLRERKEDINQLAKYFIKKHGIKGKTIKKIIDHDTQKILLDYTWPGNIRELENAIEHALAMAQGQYIKPEHLPVQIISSMSDPQAQPFFMGSPLTTPSLSGAQVESHNYRDELLLQSNFFKPWKIEEKKAIWDALMLNKGNRTLTAKYLGISRSTLWRKMTMYHVG